MSNAVVGVRIGDYSITGTLSGASEFEATHILLPRQARIRIADETGAKRLMREACILEALRHPGVPRVYECGRLEDRRPWIAIELLDGPTLGDAIADRALPVADTLALLRDLGEILHHVHMRGVVHCRIRPEVIVRHANGLCITDWGAAATHDSMPDLGGADAMYVAPEIARGEQAEARADVYSLGVLAYKALALASPRLPLGRQLPGLPHDVADLVDRMLSSTPLVRPSAAEVRAEAIRLLYLLAIPAQDDIGAVIEEIEVELSQDISRDPRDPPPIPRVRWTPADAYQPRPEEDDDLPPHRRIS